LLHGLLQSARAKIIRAALEHREVELHRFGQRAEHTREHRQIFFRELFLKIDCVGRDDGFLLVRYGEQDGGHEIRKRLADARTGFHGEMFLVLQRPGHGHGHFLLLWAELEVGRSGKNPARRENFLHLRHEVCARRLILNCADHSSEHSKLTIPFRVKTGRQLSASPASSSLASATSVPATTPSVGPRNQPATGTMVSRRKPAPQPMIRRFCRHAKRKL
jgi:hypothetical protein